MKRIHISIHGRVQGVFFRTNTQEMAQQLGLKGYVRNMDDGSVEAVAEGDEDNLNKFVEFCKIGKGAAQVGHVHVRESEATGEFSSFEVRS